MTSQYTTTHMHPMPTSDTAKLTGDKANGRPCMLKRLMTCESGEKTMMRIANV